MQRSATSRPECLMRRRADDVDLRVPLAKRTGTIYFGLCYDRGLSHFGPAARSWSLRLTAPNVSITLPGKDSPSGRDCEERNHLSQDRESARLTVPRFAARARHSSSQADTSTTAHMCQQYPLMADSVEKVPKHRARQNQLNSGRHLHSIFAGLTIRFGATYVASALGHEALRVLVRKTLP
jgi:hypothetical protein